MILENTKLTQQNYSTVTDYTPSTGNSNATEISTMAGKSNMGKNTTSADACASYFCRYACSCISRPFIELRVEDCTWCAHVRRSPGSAVHCSARRVQCFSQHRCPTCEELVDGSGGEGRSNNGSNNHLQVPVCSIRTERYLCRCRGKSYTLREPACVACAKISQKAGTPAQCEPVKVSQHLHKPCSPCFRFVEQQAKLPKGYATLRYADPLPSISD